MILTNVICLTKTVHSIFLNQFCSLLFHLTGISLSNSEIMYKQFMHQKKLWQVCTIPTGDLYTGMHNCTCEGWVDFLYKKFCELWMLWIPVLFLPDIPRPVNRLIQTPDTGYPVSTGCRISSRITSLTASLFWKRVPLEFVHFHVKVKRGKKCWVQYNKHFEFK
jgi:hypothetical protein